MTKKRQSSGTKSPVIPAMRIAQAPCPVCQSEYREVKVYASNGKRKLGTPIRCYMDTKHDLGKGKALRLAKRVKSDIVHQHKQLIALGIDPKGVTYMGMAKPKKSA